MLNRKLCLWCKKHPPSQSNAFGWCNDCYRKDKYNPPEQTSQKMFKDGRLKRKNAPTPPPLSPKLEELLVPEVEIFKETPAWEAFWKKE